MPLSQAARSCPKPRGAGWAKRDDAPGGDGSECYGRRLQADNSTAAECKEESEAGQDETSDGRLSI